MKLGVFIERDGILNQARVERQHQVSPLTLEEFKLNREAVPLLKMLKDAGLMVIVTTSQPGISRGYQSRGELDRMHDLLRKTMPIDDLMLCAHDESDRCPCRKPAPGLLTEAAHQYHLHLDHSFVVGMRWQDAEAARLVGCTSLLIDSPWVGKVHRDFVLPDFASTVKKILSLHSGAGKMAGAYTAS